MKVDKLTISRTESLGDKIVLAMAYLNAPCYISDVQGMLKSMSFQAISYQIKKMVSTGVILPIECEGEKTKYMLHPVFYDSSLLEEVFRMVSPLYVEVMDKSEEENIDEDPSEVVRAVINAFCNILRCDN